MHLHTVLVLSDNRWQLMRLMNLEKSSPQELCFHETEVGAAPIQGTMDGHLFSSLEMASKAKKNAEAAKEAEQGGLNLGFKW